MVPYDRELGTQGRDQLGGSRASRDNKPLGRELAAARPNQNGLPALIYLSHRCML
jgi:hypothetical protein